jgi:hypothetical protein
MKTRTKYYYIIGYAITISMILSSLILFNSENSNLVNEASNLKTSLDSLKFVDKTFVLEIDSARQLILNFYDSLNNHSLIALNYYYTDTLKHFFLLDSVPKNKAIELARQYWMNNSDHRVIVAPEDISIVASDSIYVAYVKIRYKKVRIAYL